MTASQVSHDSVIASSMSNRRLSMCSTTLAPLVVLLVVSRVVGQNVANLHFCPGPKKKFALLSHKNDLLSRLVINGGIFCPGTERRKSGTERRKNGTERVGQKGRDRTSHILFRLEKYFFCSILLKGIYCATQIFTAAAKRKGKRCVNHFKLLTFEFSSCEPFKLSIVICSVLKIEANQRCRQLVINRSPFLRTGSRDQYRRHQARAH